SPAPDRRASRKIGRGIGHSAFGIQAASFSGLLAVATNPAGPATSSAAPPNFRRRLVAGVGGGVALGLFVGERASALDVVADAYIKLLQMTVLPYVTLSLVGGIGSLSGGEAKRVGTRWGAGRLVPAATGRAGRGGA